MKTKSSSRLFIIIIFAAFLNFVLLTFLKYNLNQLSIREFRFGFIGNILNMLIFSALISGCIAQVFYKNNLDLRRRYVLLILQVISIIVLSFIFIIYHYKLVNENSFILSFPLRKVYIGILYSISIFIQIFSMIYALGALFPKENLYELRTLIRTTVLIAIIFLFTLFYVWNVGAFVKEKVISHKFEYGLIPGAAVWKNQKPSPIFESRIRKGYELYKESRIQKFVLTGSNAPGEISEAESALKYLLNLGVNRKDILIERHTSTTIEQVKFIRLRLFPEKKDSSVLFISDGFHLTRITQIAKFFHLKSYGVSSGYQLSFNKAVFYRTREAAALLLFWFFAI